MLHLKCFPFPLLCLPVISGIKDIVATYLYLHENTCELARYESTIVS